MKPNLLIALMLMTSVCVMADNTEPSDVVDCDSLARFYNAQSFFCDCEYDSHPFAFPLDTVISDTVWFTATVEDLKQGLSAYWFSNSSVTMEVYAICQSSEPTFTLTIGANQMREMDINTINKKIDEMGNAASFISNLTPHIRVYPRNGGSGRVYCYPYDKGPHSTCEDPLELRYGMTYVCDHAENVYRMPWSNITSTDKTFIEWKQQKSQPADIWLTVEACDGEEIGRAKLTDSLHVYQPSVEALKAARTAKKDLWLHVKHANNITGRVQFYKNPKYYEPAAPVTGSTCEGKKLSVNMRSYTIDTAFIDTIWIARDTLQTQEVKFTFTPPTMEFDTVTVKATELNYGYVHTSGHVLTTYGDTIIDITKANTCTRRIQVTVLEEAQGIENKKTNVERRKIIENGQLVILIDDRKYNVLGQQIDK